MKMTPAWGSAVVWHFLPHRGKWHAFVTISLENGDDIKTVSENLGHATVAFTMDTYAHVTDAMKKRSGDRMQEYIERALKHG